MKGFNKFIRSERSLVATAPLIPPPTLSPDDSYSLDNLEHELEERAEDLAALLEVEAHVEGLDVGQVLQQVEVALEGRVLRVLEAAQLLDQEVEDGLDLHGVLVRRLGGENPVSKKCTG